MEAGRLLELVRSKNAVSKLPAKGRMTISTRTIDAAFTPIGFSPDVEVAAVKLAALKH
jgi:hypothetical protein